MELSSRSRGDRPEAPIGGHGHSVGRDDYEDDRSPLGGPVVIRIGAMRLAIEFGMAGKVMVDVERAGKLLP